MAAMKQSLINKVDANPMEFAEALRDLAGKALAATMMFRGSGASDQTAEAIAELEEAALFARDLLEV